MIFTRKMAAAATAFAVAGVTAGVVASQSGGSGGPGCGPHSGPTFTSHVVVTSGSPSYADACFEQGLEVGAFKSTTAVHVSLSRVEILNPSGTPGAPNARGLAVLPGATVTGTDVTVHHTLGDGIGVLGGDLTLSGCRDYDNFGGAPLNTDHVDGLQVTSGTATLSGCRLGLDANDRPARTGNVQCKGDAGLSVCNLTDTVIAGYGGRIALNYEAGAHAASGSFDRLTIDTQGTTGAPLVIRSATVQQGSLTKVASWSAAGGAPSSAPAPSSTVPPAVSVTPTPSPTVTAAPSPTSPPPSSPSASAAPAPSPVVSPGPSPKPTVRPKPRHNRCGRYVWRHHRRVFLHGPCPRPHH